MRRAILHASRNSCTHTDACTVLNSRKECEASVIVNRGTNRYPLGGTNTHYNGCANAGCFSLQTLGLRFAIQPERIAV